VFLGLTMGASYYARDDKRDEQDEALVLVSIDVVETECASQVTSCKRISEIGSRLQIPPKVTTLREELITMELLLGLLRAVSLTNGTGRARSCGCMVNVRVSQISRGLQLLMAPAARFGT
jgi:hypothetical protein